MAMLLKPQDIVFLLKLVAKAHEPWTYNGLAVELGMSPSEVHYAAQRAVASRLAIKNDQGIRVNIQNLLEFILHGIQYSFIPERGGLGRGLPTAHAVAPLVEKFAPDNGPPPVWPDPKGSVRGESLTPLHKSVPVAVKTDPKLYELLALVDAIRSGRAREKEMAKKEITKRLEEYERSSKP